MNAERRKRLETARRELSQVLDEEQDARENLPESLQDSDKAAVMDENIANIETALDVLDNID